MGVLESWGMRGRSSKWMKKGKFEGKGKRIIRMK
jgi:hypothetical protein